MLNFPEKTRCNRRLPKEKFYEHLPMTAKLERAFIDGIASIKLVNVISPETMNITASDGFSEIGVIEIVLKTFPVDEFVLETMDKVLPFYAVYLVEFKGSYQVYIAYKEKTATSGVKVVQFYHTERTAFENLPLALDGTSVAEIYTNFVTQVSGGKLNARSSEDLAQAVQSDLEIKKLEEKIAQLEKKIRLEKQFNRQVELSNQKRELEQGLKDMKK